MLTFCYKTDKGAVRPNNEDALIYRTNNNNPDSFDIKTYGSLFTVADGMGGHFAGEVASNIACKSILNYYKLKSITDDNIWDQLKRLYYRINETVLQNALNNPDFNGMGTTLSTLIIREEKAWIAHVGDSRIYRIRDGIMDQITYDHTEVQRLIDQGFYTKQQAATCSIRNILTQAIGVDNRLDVFTWAGKAMPGDRYLLCSDGLHDMVSDEEILSIILYNSGSLKNTCLQLLDKALRSGGKDNITLMVVLIL
ncbi:serine/threonine protein phosphatase [Candidatus Magnetomorum sp. HK-1]|nr:serine/threonine protein phosphatase [Candidatus Magnetomorum sp. HK-1]